MRSEQLSLRVQPETKSILQQAAAIAGQSLTDFMVATSAEKARILLEQHRIITLAQSSFDEFSSVLLEDEVQPATPLAQKLIDEYAKSVQQDGTLRW